MSTKTAGQGLQPADFETFGRVHAARKRRQTGRELRPATVYHKQMHLAAVARMMGCPDPLALGRLLQDRKAVEDLLDRLGSKMSPGAMRSPVYALLDFADFARGQGWGDTFALTKADVPKPNPQKPIT